MSVVPRRASRVPLARVLVVDSDDDIREVLGLGLQALGLTVDCAGSVAGARALLTQRSYRLCLTDDHLQDGSGLDLVRHIRDHCRGLPVVVLTASASMESAVAALKAGAADCLAKPVSLDELRALLSGTLDIALPGPPTELLASPGELVGHDPAIEQLRQAIPGIARSRVAVALCGETGTGKELVARLIHAASARADQPFVAIDCAAIRDEAELFGAVKGSAPEGNHEIEGLLHAAEGGTVFFDGVDEMAPTCQVRLARALKDRRVRRVGAVFDEPMDIRVISSSAHPLRRALDEGRLREALYYRLARVEWHLPSLRDRRGDIALLAAHVLSRLGDELGVPKPACAEDALAVLMSYAFPGNVAELECVLERALATARADVLHAVDLRLSAEPLLGE